MMTANSTKEPLTRRAVPHLVSRIPLWLWIAVLAVALLLTQIVPWTGPDSVESIWDRTAHIIVFLVAITVVAELFQLGGLFDWLADTVAALARGSTPALFVGMVLLGAASTIILSLDTTAVLLTPVVLAVCARSGIPPALFALIAVWMANAGSLLLPVSNLTNLLAASTLDVEPLTFARIMLVPSLIAIVVPAIVLAALHFRTLRVPYRVNAALPVVNRTRFTACVVALVCMVAGFAVGLPVHLVAATVCVILLAIFAIWGRELLTWKLVPWRLVVLTLGLFVVMAGVGRLGADSLAATIVSSGNGLAALLQNAMSGLVGANLMNNLPAYLVLEKANPEGSEAGIYALLIGVNAGATILPQASLATILWWDRCRAAGVTISAKTYILVGLLIAPVTVVLSTVGLWWQS